MTVPLAFLPTTQDITVPSGVTTRLSFRWLIDAVPQSLAGYSAVLTVARRAGSRATFAVNSELGSILLEPGGQTGVLEVTLPPALTALLRRNARYDLVIADEFGNALRLFEGAVTVDLGVTSVDALPIVETSLSGPARFALRLYRGDSFAMAFVARTADGTPIDLTGSSVLAQIKDPAGGLLTAFTGTVTDQAVTPGQVTLALSAAQTAALPAQATYDVQVTSVGGDVRTYLAGSISTGSDVSA